MKDMTNTQIVGEDTDFFPILVGEKVKANYSEQPISAYSKNPFIEALPPIMEMHEVAKGVRNYLDCIEEHRNLGKMTRLHLVQQLCEYVEPLPVHFLVEQRLSRILRHGYRARNPLPANMHDNSQLALRRFLKKTWIIRAEIKRV
jgi:hypothetical protein